MSLHTITVPDLSCQHCVATVTSIARALPGVRSCEVDLAHTLVHLDVADDTTLAELLRRFDDAGYPAASQTGG